MRTCCHSAEQGTSIKLQCESCRGVVRPRNRLHRRSCIACGGTLKLSSFAMARRNAHDLMVGMTMSSWSARAGFDMAADDVRAAWKVVHCAPCCFAPVTFAVQQSSGKAHPVRREALRLTDRATAKCYQALQVVYGWQYARTSSLCAVARRRISCFLPLAPLIYVGSWHAGQFERTRPVGGAYSKKALRSSGPAPYIC